MVEMDNPFLKSIHDSLHQLSEQLKLISKQLYNLAEETHTADGAQRRLDDELGND
jgi:hypothetical protein